jgi:hypothetical protein
MEFRSAFLANYVEVRGNLVNALGAFPEWWDVPSLPFVAGMHICVAIELQETDFGQPCTFEFFVHRPEGRDERIVALQAQKIRAPEYVEGSPIYALFAIPLPVNVGSVGLHEIIVHFNGGEATRLRTWVREVPGLVPANPVFGLPPSASLFGSGDVSQET